MLEASPRPLWQTIDQLEQVAAPRAPFVHVKRLGREIGREPQQYRDRNDDAVGQQRFRRLILRDSIQVNHEPLRGTIGTGPGTSGGRVGGVRDGRRRLS